MGASSGARPVGFASTAAPIEAALLRGWPAWPLNASVNLNHSLLLGAELATNRSAARATVPVAEREKNWPALLFLVIIFLTVGGNILVILAVSLEKRLQNATNFFLRSLAVADMLVGILVMPVSLINILYGGYLNPPTLTLHPHPLLVMVNIIHVYVWFTCHFYCLFQARALLIGSSFQSLKTRPGTIRLFMD